MGDGRILEWTAGFIDYPTCRLPSASARQSNGNSRYPFRIRITTNMEQNEIVIKMPILSANRIGGSRKNI